MTRPGQPTGPGDGPSRERGPDSPPRISAPGAGKCAADPAPPPACWNRATLAALAGFAAGVLAWGLAVLLVSRASSGIPAAVVRARELGVVSFTILAGYDKGQELVAWLLGCVIVPCSTWAAWAASRPPSRSAGRRGSSLPEGDATTEGAPEPAVRRGPPLWAPRVGLLATVLAVALRPRFLSGPSPWGSFGLLGEEGVYLGAVQAIRSGRVLYSDVEFPYGPLMIHPLNLWLWLSGDTIVMARAWVLLLHVLGLLGAATAIRLLVFGARAGWAAMGCALALAAFAPIFLPNLNSALLRPVLAFLPAALVVAAARRPWVGDAGGAGQAAVRGRPGTPLWRCPLLWAGVLLSIGGLFSFDVGAAGLVGVLAAVPVLKRGFVPLLRIALGAVAAALPVVLPMARSGSLAGLAGQGWRMITLPAMGWQALPYPDPAALFGDPSGQAGSFPPSDPATATWAVLPPLLIWLGLGLGLCRSRRDAARGPDGLFALSVTASVLFRAALGRSDLYHLWFYGAVPVALIGTLLIARLWDASVQEFRPLVPCLAALLVVALVAQGAEQRVRFPESEEVRLGHEHGFAEPLVARRLKLPRSGRIELLPRLAAQVEAIAARASRLHPADAILFYPSEATFYYLLDRRPPTRFLWAYDAATSEMQEAAISEMERERPRWLFRSTDTFPVDHIPQDRLVPRVDAWLQENYRPVETLPGAVLLERIGR